MRCTGPAMMDFQNDKSNIASRPFMELLEFRSMIFLEAKRDSWKTFFPAAALPDVFCAFAAAATICGK